MSNWGSYPSDDQILAKFQEVLKGFGLDQEFDIDSIVLYAKHGAKRSCPPGTSPKWKARRTPGGQIIFEWVCE
jgi:hypothetical protein